MTASSNAMPPMRARHDGIVRAVERGIVLALIALGALPIVVPLLLILYVSLFEHPARMMWRH
jgi:hypothetical protein